MTVFIVAGETSGDLHAGALAREIREREPGTELVGAGGPRMSASGVRILLGLDDLSAFGFAQVARELPRLRRTRNRLDQALRKLRPDVFVPVDFGGMNLRLARTAHAAGIPVVYFVSPQVWAWRSGRVETIRRFVDRMIVILPFEERFYRERGIEVEYVGHPLVDEITPRLGREAFRARLGVRAGERLVALLPGSRAQEVARHLPIQAGAAERIVKGMEGGDAAGGVQFAVAAASTALEPEIRRLVATRRASIAIVQGETNELLAASDLALVASGTATVQCALHGTPMVVMYRVTALEHALARRMVRVPYIAMVNLIAGRQVVPELVQNEAHPERVSEEALRLLTDSAARDTMVRELAGVRTALGSGGAARRAAEIVLSYAGRTAGGRTAGGHAGATRGKA